MQNHSHGPTLIGSKPKENRRVQRRSSIAVVLLYVSFAAALLWFLSLYALEHQISDHLMQHEHSKLAFMYSKYNYHDNIIHEHTDVMIPSAHVGYSNNRNDPTVFLTMYGEHRFQSSFNSLPLWLQEYFNWHREQTFPSSHIANKKDTKYLVMSCLPQDDCGGLSDRLRPIPFFLMVARYTNRVLCIHWKKNYGLEEFLQPIPKVGIDWRCPTDIDEYYDINKKSMDQPKAKAPGLRLGHCPKKSMSYAACVEEKIEHIIDTVHTKYASIDLQTRSPESINDANLLVQEQSYGFNEEKELIMPSLKGWEYPDMIEHIFRVMFEPIPILARRINTTMTKLGLVENNYVSVHVRTRYPNRHLQHLTGGGTGRKFDYDIGGGMKFEGNVKKYIVNLLNNALECGHKLAPDLKLFLITDHNDATNYAISKDIVFDDKNGGKITIRPIGIHRDEEVLHMEGNHTSSKADAFYSVFEDLLIMGGSRCVVHGIGSFGSFGAGLVGNRCRASHRVHTGRRLKCPNNKTQPIPVVFNEADILWGDEDELEGKILYDKSKYVQTIESL